MNIRKIVSIYFSPNGSTRKIVNNIAKNIGNYDLEEINLNSIEERSIKREFAKDELLIIGLPVYADRLPELSKDIFKNIKGNYNPAIAVVTYGNRDYGDALLELKDKLKESNMKTISAAAIIAEHCLNHNVATDRPDEEDNLRISDYIEKTRNKIKGIKSVKELEDIWIAGNHPYHPLKSHQVPIGDEKCIECGLCEENCPVNAISKENYRLTDSDKCIGCGSCINICPTDARAIRNKEFIQFMKKLEDIAKERKEIEVFM